MKKLLALVLALVMSMSLVTISNADFKDADKISNEEAVAVMNAIGVLAGYDNGNFGPTDTLTRAQACKIIAYLDLGAKTADAIKGSGTVFSDVPATAWYAGYVEYCAGAGYVAGVGNGKFAPDEKVTATQFAKMLLCALGYDAKVEGYTGADYTIAIARDANKNDLFDGLSIVTSAALTREQAAQMALNALVATCVEYEGGTEVSTADGTTVKVNATRSDVATNGYCYLADCDDDDSHKTMELCEKLYKGDLQYSEEDLDGDDYGRAAEYQWTYEGFDEDNDDVVYTAYATATYTYTTSVTNKALYNKVGKTVAGYDWKDVDGDDAAAPEKDNTSTYGDTAKGMLTEIFVDSDEKEVTVLYIPTYAAKIVEWTEADEDDDVDESITVELLDDYDDIDETANGFSLTFETTAFSEDDADDETVVYITMNAEKLEIVTVAKAEMVSAKVSKTSGSSFVAGGETYNYSANAAGDTVAYKNTYDLYFDSYGYVIYAEETENENETMFAIVEKYAKSTAQFADADDRVAIVVFTDGTKKTVNVEKKADFNTNDGYKLVELSYDEDDDIYTIENVAETLNSEVSFKKGASNKFSGDVTNSKTLFLVATYDDDNEIDGFDVYTGIKKMPSMSSNAVQYLADDGVVTIVYVEASEDDETDLDSTIFILNDDDVKLVEDEDGEYYEYAAVVNGKVTTLKVARAKKLSANVLAKSVSTNSKGLITSWTAVDTFEQGETAGQKDASGAIVKASNDVIKFNGEAYGYDEDAVVYQIDDGEITELKGIESIASTKTGKTANTTLVLTKGGVITAVYFEVK